MKKIITKIAVILVAAIFIFPAFLSAKQTTPLQLKWGNLSSLPNPMGLSGTIVGVSNNALIIAGGSNFPKAKPWDGGTKQFYNKIYALITNINHQYQWTEVGALKDNLGYPASVNTQWGIVVIGGGNSFSCSSNVLLLNYDQSTGKVTSKSLPSLPTPSWFGSASIADGKIYYFGGQHSPTGGSVSDFLSFDLKSYMAGKTVKWTTLPAFPGKSRVLAAMVSQLKNNNENIYVISGRNLNLKKDGSTGVTFLKDGYRFDIQKQKWSKIASLHSSICAAPYIAVEKNLIVAFGGDDGSLFGKTLKESHPGFSKIIYIYNTNSNSWTKAGPIPLPQVTTSATIFNNEIVIPCGEIKPGIRTPIISTCKIK